MNTIIEEIYNDKLALLQELKATDYFEKIEEIANIIVNALNEGKKILVAGNGGSAADAQHFAGEIVGRFEMERNGLPALSLCVDPTVISAISNDYGFENVYSRQVEALGEKGDVFLAISTSGNSENCYNATLSANKNGLISIGLLGGTGGKISKESMHSMIVPSSCTARVQEVHTFTIHILCKLIENGAFRK